MPSTVSTYDLLQKIAVFGERRQQVLAENIANIDTPGYKARDLDVEGFQDALRQASKPASSASTPAAGMQAFAPELFAPRETSALNITFQDGAQRSIEREVTELTKNLMMQNFAIEMMSAQTKSLEAVISGRV